MPVPPPSLDFPPVRLDNLLECTEYYLGVDEAGRGPVLGPLVYGLFLCPVQQSGRLKEIGVADSKALNEAERENLFKKMLEDPDMSWVTRIISPLEISDSMLRVQKYNLNELSYDTVYSLLEQVLTRVKVKTLFVDTLGPPKAYQQRLELRFPQLAGKIIVAPKADALYPPVSAASIIAKVTRDYCLKNWVFEDGPVPVKHRQFGCGYPGDPVTVKWLEDHVHEWHGFPDIVRFSWSSCQRILDEKAIKVVFDDEVLTEEAAGSKRKPSVHKTVPKGVQFSGLTHI